MRISAWESSEAWQPIHRAFDARRAAIEDVGVSLCGGYVAVPEKFLHGADVVAVFQQMSGEGVAQSVRILLMILRSANLLPPPSLLRLLGDLVRTLRRTHDDIVVIGLPDGAQIAERGAPTSRPGAGCSTSGRHGVARVREEITTRLLAAGEA